MQYAQEIGSGYRGGIQGKCNKNLYQEPPCDYGKCDNNFFRFVGWQEDDCTKRYFNPQTVRLISRKVTDLLQGVDPQNRDIIVTDDIICSVMSNIYENYRPQTGDIYGRYNVPSNEPEDYIQSMIDQTIEIITSSVRDNMIMAENNKKLSVWSTVLGDFNTQGLRQFPPIKIRDKNTSFRGMVSFMNY